MKQRSEVTFRHAPRKLGGGGALTQNKTDSNTCRAFDMPDDHDDGRFENTCGLILLAVWAGCCLAEAFL